MSSWCSRYSRTCLAFIDCACFWSQCACREHVSSRKQMSMCVEEVSGCTYIIAYHTQPMGNSRELNCTTDDPSTRCWRVPPVWRQVPARKDTFQPSQGVHTGTCGRKVTHTPWGQQDSNTVIQQFHHFSYDFVPSVTSEHHGSVWREVCIGNAPLPIKVWKYFLSSWASPASFFRSMLSDATQL